MQKLKCSQAIRMLLFVTIGILLVSNILAFEFDNKKEYDPSTKIVKVKNAFGLGDDIADIQLISPSNIYVMKGEDRLVAEFSIYGYKDYENIFNDMQFYDVRTLNEIERTFTYKKKIIEKVKVDNYEFICDYEILINGSKRYYNCDYIKVGDHFEDRVSWIPFNGKDFKIKKNQKEIVGVFTKVYQNDYVDWIPSLYGVRIDEWATWTESFNLGLTVYYNFDETAGTNLPDIVRGVHNGTNQNMGDGHWVSGILNNSLYYNGSTEYTSITDHAYLDNISTISVWFNFTQGVDSNYERIVVGKDTDYGRSIAIRRSATGDSVSYYDDALAIKLQHAISLHRWYHVALVFNSTHASLYVNGTLWNYSSATNEFNNANNILIGGGVANRYYTGRIDELGIWNRSLSSSEVSDLWNNGLGLTYTLVPTVVLNHPPNNNGSKTASVYVNCSATDATQVNNITLWFNGAVNQTVSGVSPYLDIAKTLNFAEGEYNWTCSATDDENNIAWASSNYTFTVDLTDPVVNQANNLTNLTTLTLPLNSSWNYTVSDNNLELCYYNYTGSPTLIYITCNTANIQSNHTAGGVKLFRYCANDTAGRETCLNKYVDIRVFSYNQSVSDRTVGEGDNVTFTFFINATNLGTDYPYSTANLTLNSIVYPNATRTVLANNITFVKSVIIPDGWGDPAGQTVFFNWSYNITDNVIITSRGITATENITVYTDSMNISTGCGDLDTILFYTFADEQNTTNISQVDIDYNFEYSFSAGATTHNTLNGSFTADNISFCINATDYSSYYVNYGEISYSKEGWSSRRYYIFQNGRFTNVTISDVLYLLINADSTSFLTTAQDTDLRPYEGYYLTLNRWYPNLDTYDIVEMGKTDDDGETVLKVDVEDVDYRVGVYDPNGTLIYLASPKRFVCVASPCTYTLNVLSDATDQLQTWLDLQFSLAFNDSTNVFTFIFSDPSQTTDYFNLSVYRESGISSVLICSDTDTGYSGVLTCNVSGYTGIIKALAYRSASPEVPIIMEIVNLGSGSFSGTVGLFFTFLMVIIMGLVGAVSPILAVIFSVLAFIPAVIFRIIPLAVMMLLSALGFIVITFMRRSR